MVVVLCAAGNLSTLIDRRNGKRKTEMSLGLMFNFFPLPSDEALLRLPLLFLLLLLLLLLLSLTTDPGMIDLQCKAKGRLST